MSESELAARFFLSLFTVRRSIELLTNEGWLEKRHGSGIYVKSAKMDKSRTGVIGVVTTYVDDYIFPSIIQGIEDVLTQQGYPISLGLTENKVEKEDSCLRAMLDQNVDGLIIEGTKSAFPNPNIKLLEEFRQKNIPIVFINGNYTDFESSYVLMDDEKSGSMATKYLIDNGHTNIGGIFKSDDIQGHRRYKGFIQACHESSLTVNEEAVLWYTTEDLNSIFTPEYDPPLMQRFAGCTAILCYNDQIAVRMIETIGRSGRHIPEDISIIGFDNFDLCEMSSPKITSITHARKDMGISAARALLRMILSKSPEYLVKLRLPSQLIVRNSVKILKSGKKK